MVKGVYHLQHPMLATQAKCIVAWLSNRNPQVKGEVKKQRQQL